MAAAEWMWLAVWYEVDVEDHGFRVAQPFSRLPGFLKFGVITK